MCVGLWRDRAVNVCMDSVNWCIFHINQLPSFEESMIIILTQTTSCSLLLQTYMCAAELVTWGVGPDVTNTKWNSRYNQTQSWMLKLVTVYAYQRVLMVVVLLPLLSRILRLSPSQVHNYTCCKLIPILQYGDESTLYYSHTFRVILAPGYLYYAGNYARIMDSRICIVHWSDLWLSV